MKQRPEALDSLVPTFFSPLVLGTTVAPVASLLSWSHLRIFKSTWLYLEPPGISSGGAEGGRTIIKLCCGFVFAVRAEK